ncbi:Bifunctional transcriptional activator/DNA repair enzyme AdaA [Andreprevotia sp. IGB-42]|uniref:helix-turn-helix domain-containing protein n=1 Tax=Andreprevotia sp. IGB-42 TaxID=2497473 RepID=UPI00135B5A3F|nr:AraC family transcriptional regulator [Andreprevotia sp. IGB-42]KAF0812903.1 Bifunctional transcriptional activator/DNA repair enzyme AdaA [Andreprevotia sp. IGB-42]
MRPQFEHVTVPGGASWALLWRELPVLPFEWHYHPEYELTFTVNARGQRYVGDHFADFDDGDLVLVGPNLPHTWSSNTPLDGSRPMLAVVVWFTRAWVDKLVDGMPELQPLRLLASHAAQGLAFSPAVAARVRPLLLSLNELSAARRIPVLLDALLQLSADSHAQTLAALAATPAQDSSRDRLARILERLHSHFAEPLSVAALAGHAALSVGAFHRFFKRHTGKTVLEYQAQLRIGHACQLLIQTAKPVGVIASEAGWNNLAHFNRQFLAAKGITPKAFRAQYTR